MVQQCAEATEQAAPGKHHQIVIVGILYTITMDEQEFEKYFWVVLPQCIKHHVW